MNSESNSNRHLFKRWLIPIDIIYYVLFLWFFNYSFMFTTMFYSEHLIVYSELFKLLNHYASNALLVVSIISAVIVPNKPQGKFVSLLVIVMACTYDHYRGEPKMSSVAIFLLLLVGSQGKSIKFIFKSFFICGWCWLFASYIGCKLGYLPDIGFQIGKHSFGTIYNTDLACHLLTLVMMYCVLKNGKLKVIEYAGIITVILVNVMFIKGKVSFVCMVLVLLGTIYYQYVSPRSKIKREQIRLFSVVSVTSIFFFSLLSIIMSKYYSDSPDQIINKYDILHTFSTRFAMGKVAFDNYPIRLWGTEIIERGNGGNVTGETVSDYYYLDISYIRLLFIYGTTLFACVTTIFALLQYQLCKKKQYYFAFLVGIFLLDCFVEHHIFELSYSFFPFLLFCNDVREGEQVHLDPMAYNRIKIEAITRGQFR